MIKIVTDSTCDLLPDWLARFQITVVPVNIQFGLESFQEGVTITPQDFYQRIHQSGLLPTTSQPSVGQFVETYRRLGTDGSQILSIHLTGQLSGTWQAATMAAKQLQHSADIVVIDSWTGSVGLGFMVREAAQLAQMAMPRHEIVARLEARRQQVKIYLMLNDLRYARMSGRVGRIQESLVSLLNVKPIIGVVEGALVPLERTRGRKRGLERMITLAEQAVGAQPVHAAVAHAIDPVQAENLLEQIKSRFNCTDTFIADLALSIAVHFGPGTVGFAVYPTYNP